MPETGPLMKPMEFFVKRYLLVLLLICSFVASSSLGAVQRPAGSQATRTPQSQTGTAAAPARAAEAGIVTKTLANGLEIIVVEDHSIPPLSLIHISEPTRLL